MNRWRHTRLQPGIFSFRWLTVTSSCIAATTKCASSSGRTNWLLGWGGLLVMINLTWRLLWFFSHSSVSFVHFLFLFLFCCCRFCWKQVCMWLKYLVGFFVSFQREDELCRLMNLYIMDHRPKLVMESSQRNQLLGSFEKETDSIENKDKRRRRNPCRPVHSFARLWNALKTTTNRLIRHIEKDPTYGRGSWVFAPFEAETQACLRQADDSMQCIISSFRKESSQVWRASTSLSLSIRKQVIFTWTSCLHYVWYSKLPNPCLV